MVQLVEGVDTLRDEVIGVRSTLCQDQRSARFRKETHDHE